MTDHEDQLPESKNRAHDLLARAEERLARGEIDETGWFHEVQRVIVPAYLAGANPRSQSGYSGDATRWERARRLLCDAIHRDGTFLDVGCAIGPLMESVERWAREDGRTIETHGLDLSPELAELARRRLPGFAERIHVGNALDWRAPRAYDFVRTGLEYVPARRRRDLVSFLLDRAVAPGGRLIVGVYNEEIQSREVEEALVAWGFPVAGRTERPHRDPRLAYRAVWIER